MDNTNEIIFQGKRPSFQGSFCIRSFWWIEMVDSLALFLIQRRSRWWLEGRFFQRDQARGKGDRVRGIITTRLHDIFAGFLEKRTLINFAKIPDAIQRPKAYIKISPRLTISSCIINTRVEFHRIIYEQVIQRRRKKNHTLPVGSKDFGDVRAEDVRKPRISIIFINYAHTWWLRHGRSINRAHARRYELGLITTEAEEHRRVKFD